MHLLILFNPFHKQLPHHTSHNSINPSLQVPVLYLFLASGVQPPSNLLIPRVTKRSVTYSFTASPTSGATYKVTFTHQRAGIPQPQTETFTSVGFRTKSGLIPDVTYRLQVVAVLNGEESAAISKDFTTLPDSKTAVTTAYVLV